jgi:DNA invertase Pin-like site-specific DNA recombinase
MPKNSKGKVAIYSRKSKFTGKGESIENQITFCRQYIFDRLKDYKEDDIQIYEDEGFSGKNTDRPNFQRMMADAKAGKIDAIVCYRLDRIMRNISFFCNLIDELQEFKVTFHSVKEGFDMSTPMGRTMMFISSLFAQLERELLAERIRDNLYELAKTGRWLGGITPTGYESEGIKGISVDGKTRKACRLKIIPKEAELVQLIFTKYLEFQSLTKTETFLLQNGFVTKNSKEFSRFSIRNILTNPVYMIADDVSYNYIIDNDGELYSTKEEFDGEHGIITYYRTIQNPHKTNSIRNFSEWIIAVGKHTGIVSSKDWVEVQNLLKLNDSKIYRKVRGHTALLSGLLICGECGDYMRPKTTKRVNSDGTFAFYYMCTKKEKSRLQLCNIKNINGNELDKFVVNVINGLSENDSDLMLQLTEKKEEVIDLQNQNEVIVQQINSGLEEMDKEIKGLISTLGKVAGTPTEQYILDRIQELNEKTKQQKQQLASLQSVSHINGMSASDFDIIKHQLMRFKDIFDDLTIEKKKTILRQIIRKIVWDGKDIHIYFFGSDDSDIKNLIGIATDTIDDEMFPQSEDRFINAPCRVCRQPCPFLGAKSGYGLYESNGTDGY